MDKNKLRKEIILRLLNSPVSLLPFAGGATGLIVGIVFGFNVLAFVSFVLMLGGIGIFLTRLLQSDSKIAQAVLEEMKEEEAKERKRVLDNLYYRLKSDGDSRTESLLHTLLLLTEQFRYQLNNKNWSMKLNMQSTFDILSNVEELFNGCIRSLEQSLELWRVANSVMVKEARKPIIERREEIIKNVTESISKLSDIYAELQRITIEERGEDKLKKLRQELDDSLEIAKRVEQRLNSFDSKTINLEEKN